jgi:hypothetical protein
MSIVKFHSLQETKMKIILLALAAGTLLACPAFAADVIIRDNTGAAVVQPDTTRRGTDVTVVQDPALNQNAQIPIESLESLRRRTDIKNGSGADQNGQSSLGRSGVDPWSSSGGF